MDDIIKVLKKKSIEFGIIYPSKTVKNFKSEDYETVDSIMIYWLHGSKRADIECFQNGEILGGLLEYDSDKDYIIWEIDMNNLKEEFRKIQDFFLED